MSANNQRVEFDINDVNFILHSNKNGALAFFNE